MLLLDYYQATHRKEKRQTLLRQLLRDKDTPQGEPLRTHLAGHTTTEGREQRPDNGYLRRRPLRPTGRRGYLLGQSHANGETRLPKGRGQRSLSPRHWPWSQTTRWRKDCSCRTLQRRSSLARLSICARPRCNTPPDNQQLCYFEGFSLFQLKRNDEALASLQKTVELRDEESDSGMMADCYSLMGGDLPREGYGQGLLRGLRQLPALCTRTMSGALNNYAYYLSLDSAADLQKAEQMSLNAVQKEPDNATFLDTYALDSLQGETLRRCKDHRRTSHRERLHA